jgi:hypothetical protein
MVIPEQGRPQDLAARKQTKLFQTSRSLVMHPIQIDLKTKDAREEHPDADTEGQSPDPLAQHVRHGGGGEET